MAANMPLHTTPFLREKLSVDFASLKNALPQGVYVAPVPSNPRTWTGILFVRKGPYANAILRFHLSFPTSYPQRPPVLSLDSDTFHPLVTPLTTYTYTTRDYAGADTVSATDDQRLPPGGLSLRHGFPEWFATDEAEESGDTGSRTSGCPHIVEVLQYLRVVFDTEAVLDSIPLEAAADTGAWHAWKSFRAKSAARDDSAASPATGNAGARRVTETMSPDRGAGSPAPSSSQQQPGGARAPGEWNWQGVWESRVRRSVQASIADAALYGRDSDDVIGFSNAQGDDESLKSALRSVSESVAS